MHEDIDKLIAEIRRNLIPPATGWPAIPGGIIPVSQQIAARIALEALQRYIDDPCLKPDIRQYARDRRATLPDL